MILRKMLKNSTRQAKHIKFKQNKKQIKLVNNIKSQTGPKPFITWNLTLRNSIQFSQIIMNIFKKVNK